MYAALKDQLADDLAALKTEGLYKAEAVITYAAVCPRSGSATDA